MKYELNKLIRDDFGRVSGIIAVNKPTGLTSHDVVYRVRKALDTRKVGHAGSLDPFATGVLIILVGKATELSDEIMVHDKSYDSEILFGVSTDSHDPEGLVMEINNKVELDKSKLDKVLAELKPGYEQDVPIYSSVKVNGDKLRVLARRYHHFKITRSGETKLAEFFDSAEAEKPKLTIDLPHHFIKFDELEVTSVDKITSKELKSRDEFTKMLANKLPDELITFPTVHVQASCPKGTYLRQLAFDIGLRMDLPAMLIGLKRTRVGDVTIDQALSLEDLSSL